jgi:hypothetical protein
MLFVERLKAVVLAVIAPLVQPYTYCESMKEYIK